MKSLLSRHRTRTLGLLAGLLLSAGSASAIEPFTANYSANYMGMRANGTMTLAQEGGQRWKYSLEVTGAGARLSQTTVFDTDGERLRPLSSVDSQRGESGLAAMLVRNRTVNADFDWNAGQARWSGDVRDEQQGPVRLQPGDVDGLLLNLSLARDLAADQPLRYRLVEDGRARRQVFRPAGTETITIAGKQHQATKLVSSNDRRSITAWIVDGMPVPARILQQRDGRDHIDLRLTGLQ